ncbi:hypothetical protein TWF225_010373 [Orbilia oligospora]|uniref:Uncharacterized protein n=1 Tax=Orbilia oligospora TaxID=2813651 RepID=A0A8H2DTN7_ORBOL|nr:hypothetical protein TWF225_010373 [Orbilia oligospora]KAF3243719.1 hypothetical protein TWF128_009919 [Orbilia oligospora]KAF3250501.1 hypothetical protein TWF217_008543 [Orbilia oligospora]KAF3294853.1 hypothetical protein TWF132_002775 [Orbilia oligospora]TGJ65449.1 hypothetical protein EYR41_009414 [Orbilia oligospora]
MSKMSIRNKSSKSVITESLAIGKRAAGRKKSKDGRRGFLVSDERTVEDLSEIRRWSGWGWLGFRRLVLEDENIEFGRTKSQNEFSGLWVPRLKRSPKLAGTTHLDEDKIRSSRSHDVA